MKTKKFPQRKLKLIDNLSKRNTAPDKSAVEAKKIFSENFFITRGLSHGSKGILTEKQSIIVKLDDAYDSQTRRCNI